MKSYTIKDIAKLADVSPGTVDRVIHKRGKVSDQALEKVNKVLQEIDYQPNVLAKSLKNQKVWSIAVLIPDIDSDHYWAQVSDGIAQFNQEYQGFGLKISVFSFTSSSPCSFLDLTIEVLNAEPDAILLAPLFLHESIEFAHQLNCKKIPLITINNEIEEDSALSFIGQNLIQSGRTAANLLAQCTPNLSDVFIIHVSENPFNASHMATKAEGIRHYFKDSHVKVSEFTVQQSPKDLIEELVKVKNSSTNPAFLVTTSKAHLVANEIRNHFPNAKIIGYDLIEENTILLERGVISFLINQNPTRMGYEGLLRFSDKFIFSRDISSHYYLPIDIVTKENLQSYLNS